MKNEKIVVVTIAVIAFTALTIAVVWLSNNMPFARDENDYVMYSPQADIYEDPDSYIYESLSPPEETPSLPGADDEYLANGINQTNSNGYGEEYLNGLEFVPIFAREPLPEHIIEQITGVTFHDNTPFDYSFLTYVTVTHVNFHGESVIGHLIVADEIGDEVLEIFAEIYESGFPIYSIRLIDYFDASDYYSMAANNSHAFNFRYIAGTSVISRHGFGMAIDINPIQNPYIRGETIWPAAGVEYLDRSYVRPGMIVHGCVVYNAFISRGWIWGGNWTSPRDYHHFERRS